MKKISWKQLVEAAENAMQGERQISPFMKGGYVSTAVLTDKGNIYTGINLDCKCSIGMCSERFAVYKVFEANKNEKLVGCVCLYRDKGVKLPCGACREFFMQYGNDSEEMEILLNEDTLQTVKLKDTMSPWWGKVKV